MPENSKVKEKLEQYKEKLETENGVSAEDTNDTALYHLKFLMKIFLNVNCRLGRNINIIKRFIILIKWFNN